jgi:hypothetical protein
MDLAFVGGELGTHPDVIIGMDVLRRSSFAIDYQTRLIHFGATEALAHGAPLVPRPRFALVDSTVSGKRLRLQVDTGFNGLLLYGERLPQLAQTAASEGARVSGVVRASKVRSLKTNDLRVGDWRAPRMTVSVMDGAPRDFDEFDGLLGPRLLASRRLAFDFEHGMLYWD